MVEIVVRGDETNEGAGPINDIKAHVEGEDSIGTVHDMNEGVDGDEDTDEDEEDCIITTCMTEEDESVENNVVGCCSRHCCRRSFAVKSVCVVVDVDMSDGEEVTVVEEDVVVDVEGVEEEDDDEVEDVDGEVELIFGALMILPIGSSRSIT